MKCPFCGKEIPSGSKFCPACGQPIPQDLDYSKEQHIDQNYSDPAHEVTYSGAFSQQVSGPNGTTRINMQGGAGTAQGPLDPKKAYTEMIVMLSMAIIFATLGLVFGILGPEPTRKGEVFYFVMAFAGSFAGLFLGLLGYLTVQFRLFKIQKPSGLKDWIPTALFVINLGVTIPALIFGIQLFGIMLE